MSADYTRSHCKIAVAKILQTIGWHSINSTPMEVLTDILSNYIGQIAKITKDYSNEFGQTDPNLDHLGLAFQEMEVNSAELEEYVTYVNFVPPAQPVPKYPLPKESNLNFLKPGSKEVVTRPIHINEHLPPMYPLLEEQTEQNTEPTPVKKEQKEEEGSEAHQFKKPTDISSPEFKRFKKDEEGGRPTREISSVMMTTSGFLSPAREGKLPEAKAPAPPPEPPKPPSPIPQVPELVPVKKKPEKKKEKIGKELFKPITEEKIPKKINTMKDILKMRHAKAVAASGNLPLNNMPPGMQLPPPHFLQHPFAGDVRMPPLISHGHKPPAVKTSSFNKALAAAKAKTEKLNTTITPIPIKSEPNHFQIPIHHQVDKLVTEPDRKKINILKKISNVKEKHEKQRPQLNPHLMQQAHDIVSKINLSSDITIEPINPPGPFHHRNPVKVESFFSSGSPPGTPPTPRTPEILAHSPPLAVKTKRKRKEKPERPKAKRVKKQQQPLPHFLDSDILDMSMGRPKTPDANLIFRKNSSPFPPLPVASNPSLPFPFPLASFGGPSLIPPPMGNSLFPFSSGLPDFGKNPYFQPIPPKPEPAPKISPKPKPKPKEIIKPEPAEVVPLPIPAPTRTKTPPQPPSQPPPQPPNIKIETNSTTTVPPETSKKSKEHKKDKKEKIKKKNKKEKIKDKTEKKKLKEAKKEKDKIKKEKKKKIQVPKEEPPEPIPSIPKILLKVNSPSPRPETPDTMKKLNIKPVIKKEETSPERKPREPSPGLAKISALVTGPPKPKIPSPVTPSVEKPVVEVSSPAAAPRPPGRPRIHPLKPKAPPKTKKVEQPFLKRDAEGNEVWICPACGQQDDGRPMIGCDGCDAWYHWVCVGIQVPPDENENWYCKPCLAKKNEDLQDRKKKRKKKEKTH